MKKRILLILSIAGVMLSCNSASKEEQAQLVIDSLRIELADNQKLTEAMVEVGTLLDSIDANRKLLRTNMLEGTNYENYAARMQEINQYIKMTERRIERLEKESADRRSSNITYASALKKLKADLETREHELAALKEQVTLYRNENDNLIQTVSLQKAELEDKLSQLKTKQEEASKLEEQVKQLLVQSKLDEGEAYFARAAAVEETAKRTKFAPRKKKDTRKQALELYRLALFYGKNEAQSKIEELEKKL